jgi:16S rRNA (guanine(966)-N(2))-methyltransferase RsmD
MSSLRVIAGKAKGRRLQSVPGDTTRPITDRTKESLFNIIGNDIQDASFLDLFAGTGSVGIEALSRGAQFVRFVDHQPRAIETIRCNLKITQFTLNSEIIQTNTFRLLESKPDRQFDYIYIAPPQYHDLWNRALSKLDLNLNWLSDDAWIIAQIHPVEFEEIDFAHLSIFDRRKYGSTLLLFYQKD